MNVSAWTVHDSAGYEHLCCIVLVPFLPPTEFLDSDVFVDPIVSLIFFSPRFLAVYI